MPLGHLVREPLRQQPKNIKYLAFLCFCYFLSLGYGKKKKQISNYYTNIPKKEKY